VAGCSLTTSLSLPPSSAAGGGEEESEEVLESDELLPEEQPEEWQKDGSSTYYRWRCLEEGCKFVCPTPFRKCK